MKWIRPKINNLQPYIPGKQVTGKVLKLNANENPYSPSPRVFSVLQEVGSDALRLYPDAIAGALRKIAAEVFDVDTEQTIIGNGSDDVLTMIVRTFLDSEDSIAVVDPTYTLYETLAAIQGLKTEIHSLNTDYTIPASFLKTKSKVVFLPNPNAQTGTLFPLELVERLCNRNNNIVVIDEAYADFAGVTSIPLLKKYDNLIVLRTVSKSYSLAGIRVGFGLSNPSFISAMMKVKDSYNVNSISQLIAAEAMLDREHFNRNIGKIIETREWFSKSLSDFGWKVTPSAANFILVEPVKDSPESVMKRLEAAGILIRYFNTPRLNDKLRISIGTDEQMETLLKIIK